MIQLQNPPYLLGVIHVEPARLIRFVRALDNGHYPEDPEHEAWRQFWFRGRSVFRLRKKLVRRLRAIMDVSKLVVCVEAGAFGRLTPLVVDLPRSLQTLHIIVVIVGSPGESPYISSTSYSFPLAGNLSEITAV